MPRRADTSSALAAILDSMPRYRKALHQIREILLANAVMTGEIPAPTFDEEKRVRFVLDRFTECDCQNISTDEAGNAVSIVPGTVGERNILLLAHADTPFASSVDHAQTVHTDRIEGPGIADNSLGLAAIASMPTILDKLGIRLRDNIILLGTTRGLGRGDRGGLRFFLENNRLPIHAGICLEGVYIGRLSYRSLGMARARISTSVPTEYDWTRFGSAGSIVTLNRIISRILNIPLPREPRATIVLGSIAGGTAYNTIAAKADLRFEVRSEEAGMVGSIMTRIEDIVEECAAESGSQASLEVIARRRPGGIGYDHPLVRTVRTLMDELEIRPGITPSTGELAALIDKQIPGVTLGLTSGENLHEFNESVAVEPIFDGLAQLLALLEAIDQGLCDTPSET